MLLLLISLSMSSQETKIEWYGFTDGSIYNEEIDKFVGEGLGF